MATQKKLLDSALKLFAEHGFQQTSTRMITQDAEVNLASVNYHFGTKESLIQAVFVSFLDPLTESLLASLEQLHLDNEESIPVELVLSTFVEAALLVSHRVPNGASMFMGLLGRSFSEPQMGHLRRFLSERYQDVILRYQDVLAKAVPELEPVELFWRLHFMLGATGFALAGANTLRRLVEKDFGVLMSEREVLFHLIPFLAAGLKAPVPHLKLEEGGSC